MPAVKMTAVKGGGGGRGPLPTKGQTPAHLGPQPHWLGAPSLPVLEQLPCQALCPPAQGFASIVTN